MNEDNKQVKPITDDQLNDMMREYLKQGKFADFVNKACDVSGLLPEQECRKVTVYEYYKSVNGGCNKET